MSSSWEDFIADEMKEEYFKKLSSFLAAENKHHTIYPPKEDIFNAFKECPYDKVRAVILGQDCYHGPGQAHGLSFSVQKGIKVPPSLQNIFKELKDDLGCPISKAGLLNSWAHEGVLLLNSILTVRRGEPGSHKDSGWQIFTDKVIKKLNDDKENLVFILWGNFAKSKKHLITKPSHLILDANHPSPFSAYSGFFGSKPFSKTNEFLKSKNLPPINWHLNNED